jgi:hypothetical protein
MGGQSSSSAQADTAAAAAIARGCLRMHHDPAVRCVTPPYQYEYEYQYSWLVHSTTSLVNPGRGQRNFALVDTHFVALLQSHCGGTKPPTLSPPVQRLCVCACSSICARAGECGGPASRRHLRSPRRRWRDQHKSPRKQRRLPSTAGNDRVDLLSLADGGDSRSSCGMARGWLGHFRGNWSVSARPPARSFYNLDGYSWPRLVVECARIGLTPPENSILGRVWN